MASLDPAGPLKLEAEEIGIRDIPSFPLTSFYNLNTIRQLNRFARMLRERQINIVHSHDFYTNIFGMAGAALAGVKGRVAARRESAVRSQQQRLVERLAYRCAHAVIANCEEVGNQLAAEGVPREKIVTVHNGLDPSRVRLDPNFDRGEALTALNLPRDKDYRFVTILANLRLDFKDHPTFLRAASRVHRALPDTRFILAGEGELTDGLRELSNSLGLGTAALFIGRCQRVADLLAVSEICVLSSRAEGFSNSILEYMAAGRPVVATDVGGAREAVVHGETGYLVQSGDDEAMAERIISLLQEPALATAMGRSGRQVIEAEFSCQAQLERVDELYNRLLSNSAASASRISAPIKEMN